MTLTQQFKAARRASAPLVIIHTADPAATIISLNAAMNGKAGPILQWDIVMGIRAVNEPGKQAIKVIASPDQKINPIDAMIAFMELPDDTVIYMHQMHRCIAENGVSQAVWNLRDPFKRTHRTLVMLCPHMEVPAELMNDVVIMDEPLPDTGQLAEIVADIYRSAGQDVPADTTKETDALCGLAAFPAETAAAMSISSKGINLPNLWERKRRAVDETPGLSIYRGKETLDDIAGCDNIKEYLIAKLTGRNPARLIVFIDEIEKQLGGVGTDTSGVATEGHGILLTDMQENHTQGILSLGPPGAAKSAIAKATGNTLGLLTAILDIGATKSSLVGESGARLRQALKVINSISQGRAFFIATCNSIESLSTELRRRFKTGTFFFDLPSAEERQKIWALYIRKYELEDQILPADHNWTGAEIETCCENAWSMNISLVKAARYIVPVAISDAKRIKELRTQADGAFISASYPGTYNLEQATKSGRKLEIQ